MTATKQVGSVNLLDKITADRTLPDGYDAWAIRTVKLDFTSQHGYRYPFPGKVAKAPGPINRDNTDACPDSVGDGICAALTWGGMASGGEPARLLLLIAFKEKHVLGRSNDKLRLSQFRIVDVLSGEDEVRSARYANLCSADLCSANLRYANLYYANLRYANLRSADLRYANLCSADLYSANLCSADLRYAVGLTQAQINDARTDQWTLLPSGLVLPASAAA